MENLFPCFLNSRIKKKISASKVNPILEKLLKVSLPAIPCYAMWLDGTTF